jgi:hypothetical protein
VHSRVGPEGGFDASCNSFVWETIVRNRMCSPVVFWFQRCVIGIENSGNVGDSILPLSS